MDTLCRDMDYDKTISESQSTDLIRPSVWIHAAGYIWPAQMALFSGNKEPEDRCRKTVWFLRFDQK